MNFLGGFDHVVNSFHGIRFEVHLERELLQAVKLCMEGLVNGAHFAQLLLAPHFLGFVALELVMRYIATIIQARIHDIQGIRGLDKRINLREFGRIDFADALIDFCRKRVVKDFSVFEAVHGLHLVHIHFKNDRSYRTRIKFRKRDIEHKSFATLEVTGIDIGQLVRSAECKGVKAFAGREDGLVTFHRCFIRCNFQLLFVGLNLYDSGMSTFFDGLPFSILHE